MEANPEYIAKPCSTCCVSGVIYDGEPRGTLEYIEGVETYVTRPQEDKSNGNVILYFSDIFGMGTTNTLMMDSYASAGYLVLGLDYFQRDPVSKYMKADHTFQEGFDFEAWKTKHMKFAVDMVPKWVRGLKEKYGTSKPKYACVGYCFGAPFVMDELAGDTVRVGAFAHPAFLKDEHFHSAKKPVFMSCAENDVAFDLASLKRAVDILQSGKKDYHVQLFSGVDHGFALKGDISKPYERFAKEQSIMHIIAWFDFWLAQ